ncbi:ABC transporter ATP-binding protein [Salibacterium salarium]|uniref:ABC transporter ATP-binding protein n=1 Tax=Salibacterium salarium TaxID=284579 RepID=A0A428N6U8_9BACI|nr:ABC transporter ATP-binding protein [Salibacterium salarium]RSL33989.1 ABC transporter ATP-binding protein [Salibacterium salarium]
MKNIAVTQEKTGDRKPTHHPALVVKNLSKSFGGVNAINDVSLTLDTGRSRVMIGPNGAGKSTLFNLITGEIPLDEGEVYIFGEDVTKAPVQRRGELDLARTYQISNLFHELTVEENLYLALQGKSWELSHILSSFTSWFKNKDRLNRVRTVAESVALKENLGTLVSNLSHGEQRQLELGMALAPDPKIILFDEPMAGLSPNERIFMKKLIARLASEKIILAIEHDMDFALSLTNDVTVLHGGAVIAEGTPDEIKQNEDVRTIYKLQNA